MFDINFIPQKPFPEFKWKWACLQCTEGLNDPVILLGILFRMRKLELEGLNIKFSSDEFAKELIELDKDTQDSVHVDLANRTGERNIIRNSGQYWRALGLIPSDDHSGIIRLTSFGRNVADHKISQTEFVAITIKTFTLPNRNIQSEAECQKWKEKNLIIYPLKLILEIICLLEDFGSSQAYITPNELIKIVIPLSGVKASLQDYAQFLLEYRRGNLDISLWPDCCPKANDHRIAREFLLFLCNYGYLEKKNVSSNFDEVYSINYSIIDEIKSIIYSVNDKNKDDILKQMRSTEILSEFERKRIQSYRVSRPNQASFRKAVLSACERCIITNVSMPEILEAAHIKPFKYKGEDTVANGFAMRTDIHTLFDTGHLRISETGDIMLSPRARLDYGATIPPRIVIPSFTNKDFLRWRWENYNGI